MFFKVCALAAIVASSLAVPHATSYQSVTQHHGLDYHHNDDPYGSYIPNHEATNVEYGGYADYRSQYGNEYYLGNDDGHYDGFYSSYEGGYNGDDDYHNDYYHHPQYAYKYGVEDPHTHDIKSQEEHRDGDVVKGHYKLVQPDGRTRVVHYTADKHNGFNADVQYLGHAKHPTYYKYY